MAKKKSKKAKSKGPALTKQQREAKNRRDREAAAAKKSATTVKSSNIATTTSYIYLNVAGIRIQSWLNRTPRLRLRRGASFALTALTSKSNSRSIFASLDDVEGWEWNPEAGDVPGLISLRHNATDVKDIPVLCAHMANRVIAQMQEKLPGLQLSVASGTAETYLKWSTVGTGSPAHAQLAPPRLSTFPLAKPCDSSLQDAALRQTKKLFGDEEQWCQDSITRYEFAGYQSSRDYGYMPNAQSDLDQKLVAEYGSVIAHPSSFADALEKTDRHRGNTDTQLATIAADGNRIGSILAAYAESKKSKRHPGIPAELDRCTKQAVLEASKETLPSGKYAPGEHSIIVHLVGGDDILVTVPAKHAWKFAETLCAKFTEATKAKAKSTSSTTKEPALTHKPFDSNLHDVLLNTAKSDLTISVGMVFHHYKNAPIADVIELAEKELSNAKQQVQGREASISFLDLTADGIVTAEKNQPGRKERCISIKKLQEIKSRLDQLARVDAAHRYNLRQLIRETPNQGAHQHAELILRIQTMADDGLQGYFSNRQKWQPGVVENVWKAHSTAFSENSKHNQAVFETLRRDLDISRWWNIQDDRTIDIKNVKASMDSAGRK